ncbi:MAG TPA: hypothetical protein VEA44_12955 [Caulobacter sp.]|nr:hypothetical protein [Caulobacter sp.]
MKVILAALASAALASATMAAEPASKPGTETAKKPEAKKDPNRMVCKKTPVLGSRFPSKVCRTQVDWEKQAEIDKQNLEDAQRAGLTTCATNPCT